MNRTQTLCLSIALILHTFVYSNIWINEIHYDNNGGDTQEGIEVAGPSGIDLGCYQIVGYNGSNGTMYTTLVLSDTIPNQACGYGTKWFFQAGLQNGSPDGIALVYSSAACGGSDSVLYFLSYEGAFMANDGPAAGMMSTDILVAENGGTPVGHSLQLSGVGTAYNDFIWNNPDVNTYDQPNHNQFFCGQPAIDTIIYFNPQIVQVNEGDGTTDLRIEINPSNISQSMTAELHLIDGDAADINGFSSQTLNFPMINPGFILETINITDDGIVEGNDTLTFALRNPSAPLMLDDDSLLQLIIVDNDTPAVPRVFWTTDTVWTLESVPNLQAQVGINNPDNDTTHVHIQITGGSADEGNDYTLLDSTAFFPPMDSSNFIINLSVVDDAIVEGMEDIVLNLYNANNNAIIVNQELHAIIIDNDTPQVGQCSNLFFSEYIEGSSFNKALEIFNPTSSNIDLSSYKIERYSNGNNTASSVLQMTGNIGPGQTYIIVHQNADSTFANLADVLDNVVNYNGDDALALFQGTTILDVIGEIGIDPGSSWPVGSGSTVNQTLVRNKYVYNGNTDWVTAANEWEVLPNDFIDSLGSHFMEVCGTAPPVSISFSQTSVNADEDDGTLTYQVDISNAPQSNVTVDVSLDMGSSSTDAADYLFTPTTLTFSAGSTNPQLFNVSIIDDIESEPTETIVLNLSNVSANAFLIDSVMTVNVMDNDVLSVGFIESNFGVFEDTGTFCLSIRQNSITNDTSHVMISTIAGMANQPDDYTFSDTTIVILPGDTSAHTVKVQVEDDALNEPTEEIVFEVTVSGSSATVSNGNIQVDIYDNDPMGIADYVNSRFDVFPNPFADFVIVETDLPVTYISVFDVYGSLIREVDTENAKTSIPLPELHPGHYHIMVTLENGSVITNKLLKVK